MSSDQEFQMKNLSLNEANPTQMANLKSILSNYQQSGADSPTQLNMLTVNFPIMPQQRQRISDRNYRSRESRRNSTILEGSRQSKRRLSQQKDLNASFPSPHSTSKGEGQRQRTLDSVNDFDCILLFLEFNLNILFCYLKFY